MLVFNRSDPLRHLQIKGVGVAVEFARLGALAAILLAQMAQIAFQGPAAARPRARMLPHDIPHHMDNARVHLRMVILAAEIAAFAAELVLVADLVAAGPAGIRIPCFWGGHGAIGIKAFVVFVNRDKVLRFRVYSRKILGKVFLLAHFDKTPGSGRSIVCRLGLRQLLARWDVELVALVPESADTLGVG